MVVWTIPYGYMLALYYMRSFQWRQSKSWSALYLIANKERECLEEEVWSVAGAWWASAWAGHSRGGNSSSFFGLELFFNHTIILFCNSTLSYDGNEQDHTIVTIAMPSEVCSMFGTEVRWCRTVVEGWGATIPLNLPSTWLTHGLRRGNNQNLTIKPIMIE